MFVFMVAPVGYGWGYRRWGLPYPSYVQRRRALRADAAGNPAPLSHYSWGFGADLIWLAVILGAVWAVVGFRWR